MPPEATAGASPTPLAFIARLASSSPTALPSSANPIHTQGENTNDVKNRPIAIPIRPNIAASPDIASPAGMIAIASHRSPRRGPSRRQTNGVPITIATLNAMPAMTHGLFLTTRRA